MSLEILENNWDSIMIKVINPLWHKKFCNAYKQMKMDEDDFKSMVGEELVKAFAKYDPEESNVYTYSKMVIEKKAKTELRNAARQKRLGDIYAISIYKKENGENDTLLEEVIEDIKTCDETDMLEVNQAIAEIGMRIKPKEQKIIVLAMENFSDEQIARKLKMSVSDISKFKKQLNERSDIRRIASKYGYLGGKSYEI